MPVGRLDLCAHPAQRLGDALHRAGRQRFIAGQREAAVLERQEPDDQARQRARVATVDRRGLQAAQADAVHHELVAVVVDLHAERAHRRERRQRVARASEAANDRLTVRDGAEQQRAVRHRLVTGDGKVALER